MGNTASREVVFLLKALADPSLAQGFVDVAQKARAAQAEITKAASQGNKERDAFLKEESARAARANQEAVKSEKASQRERSTAIRQGMVERQRAEQQAAKESERLAKQTAQAQITAARDAARAQAAATQQQLQVERQAQQATVAFNRSLTQLVASRHGILMESMDVARGVAMLLSSNEETAQKLMKNLMVIQGLYDLMRGTTHIIHGLQAVQEAYNRKVELGAAAQVASAAAANSAAVAHERDAVAANADAAANMNLARAAGASGAAQGGGAVAGAVTGGSRLDGLLAGGAGFAARAIPVVGLAAIGGAAAWKLGTMGPQAEARAAEEHTKRVEESGDTARKQQEGAFQQYSGVERIRQEQAEAHRGLERHGFGRAASLDQREEARHAGDLGKVTEKWSVQHGAEALGMVKPSDAEWQKALDVGRHDEQRRQGELAKYQQAADVAATDVTGRQKALEESSVEAERYRQAAIMARSHAGNATNAAEEYRQYGGGKDFLGNFGGIGTATRWAAEMFGGNSLGTDRSAGNIAGYAAAFLPRMALRGAAGGGAEITQTQQSLDDKAAFAQQLSKGAHEKAGEKEAAKDARGKELEDSLKRRQDAEEKLGEKQQSNYEHQAKFHEELAKKAGEIQKAYLEASATIEKAGRQFAMSFATAKPEERHKELRAMERIKAGKGKTKDYELMARGASDERKEALEKEALARLPAKERQQIEELQRFKGIGAGDVAAKQAEADKWGKHGESEKAAAAEATKGAEAAADRMGNKVAAIMNRLVDVMDKRFAAAIDKAISDMNNKNKGGSL